MASDGPGTTAPTPSTHHLVSSTERTAPSAPAQLSRGRQRAPPLGRPRGGVSASWAEERALCWPEGRAREAQTEAAAAVVRGWGWGRRRPPRVWETWEPHIPAEVCGFRPSAARELALQRGRRSAGSEEEKPGRGTPALPNAPRRRPSWGPASLQQVTKSRNRRALLGFCNTCAGLTVTARRGQGVRAVSPRDSNRLTCAQQESRRPKGEAPGCPSTHWNTTQP